MKSRFLAGVVAGIVVTWAGYLAFVLAEIPFLPSLFSDLLFSVIPGGIQADGIALLGQFAKPLTLYLMMLAQTAALGFSAIPKVSAPSWAFHALLVIAPVYFFVALANVSPDWAFVSIVISIIGTIGLFLILFAAFNQALTPVVIDEEVYMEDSDLQFLKRREFLSKIGVAAGALLLWPAVSSRLTRPSQNIQLVVDPIVLPEQPFDAIPGLPSALTPTRNFYYVSKNLLPHQGNAQEPLVIDGLVEQRVEVGIEDLRAMDSIETYVTLMCVDYEPHNSNTSDLISNGLWKGVPLKNLIDQAGGPQPNTWLEMHATDGFSTAIPIAQAYEIPETMIAYEMNGHALNGRHGFPARLIAPGIYGYKNIKHINRINVVEQEYYGYWESRGWATLAPIRLMSRIMTPVERQRVNILEERWIGGIAYSGAKGIGKVEVSIDGGETWSRAEIEPALSEYSWTRWAFRWTPNHLGEARLSVRATDSEGTLQDSRIRRAFPSGATGYHNVRIEIVAA